MKRVIFKAQTNF